MKPFLLFLALVLGIWLLKPASSFCVYCSGGTPCVSNGDCPQGCRCQAPPFMQGACVQDYP